MWDILTRAGCFITIIALGYVLKRVGFFKESDFKVLSKITINITLPAAIVSAYAGSSIDPAMLSIVLLGLAHGIVCMFLGWLSHCRRSREDKAFAILNTSGINIGTFTMPFVQGFLGSMGIITAGIFDTGNAGICLGGAYSVAGMVKNGAGFSVKQLLGSLVRSVPFLCYVIMLLINLVGITLPEPVVSFAGIIGGANAFMAMLTIGVGFKLSGDRSQLGSILRILLSRYGMAAVFALGCYYLLPFGEEVRSALVILSFGPIAAANPPFTEKLKSDVGLASAVNSISIVCSIVIVVALSVALL